jgi:hypothetical protein
MPWSLDEVGGLPDFDYPPEVHYRNAMTDKPDYVQIMRDE